VRGGFLHVAQWHPRIQRRRENVPERVRPDVLGNPGPAGDPADDPPSAMAVQPPPIGGQEDGSFAALADRQVDCPGSARRERDGDDLHALAGDHQGAVPALDAERLDVGVRGFRDAQPVEGQQGDQRVFRRRAEPGADQQRAELVAVQSGGVRLVVQAGPADMRGGRVIEQFFLDRVPVETGDGAQPPG